jgi:hypothetical protein
MSFQAAQRDLDVVRDHDPDEIHRLADRLRPAENRAQILARLDALFRAGRPPDPAPSGFLPGRLLGTSIWMPFDGLVRRVASVWMPWMGKSMDPYTSTGVNRFIPSARIPLKAVFPAYTPERITAQRIDAFPFRTWVGPGRLDPDLEVFKIDYDFEANPSYLIRQILDELVQVGPDRYLGKVLFRVGGRYHPIGFFALRSA